MTHPLIPRIIDLATPVARELGLELVGAVFQTHYSPPVLRVDVRNSQDGTSLQDCEKMSRSLEATLDAAELIPDAYVLEVSSPGISRQLSADREFTAFKGFSVTVKTDPPIDGRQQWEGQLVKRDDEAVYINRKGRVMAIPRPLVTEVQLSDP
ncbi:MAG: ribosome maturation factor RimP [Cyanobacteriota bacterium]|nr:ribosome maturation factor RimP [Cyanobacteriota bacterium]